MIIGIDPGIKGAIACNSGGALSIDDMPTYEITIGKGAKAKTRKRIDAVALFNILQVHALCGVDLVVIEEVGGRPTDGGAAAFQFGWAAALVYMACIALELPIKTVKPGAWKEEMGVPGKKTVRGQKKTDAEKRAETKMIAGMIVQRADEVWPAYRNEWRGPQGGYKLDRAEAALLSVYGATHVKQETWTHDRYKDADDATA